MLQATWLQNRTPARVLEGKTPYEMLNKKVPNLAGTQEFRAAAYVKDLKAGKLDARAKVGALHWIQFGVQGLQNILARKKISYSRMKCYL